MLLRVKLDNTATWASSIHIERQSPIFSDVHHCSQLAVGDLKLMRGCGKLHPVSGGESPLLLAINGDALLTAREKGTLSGAALDVLERPASDCRHPLLDAPNVLVTPHIGGATTETLARGARRAVAAVASLVAGRVPADVVNPQVLHAGSAMT